MFISVIIPVYNYAHTIERAISSVVKQLDKQSELIVIDDGSTDNSLQVISRIQEELNNPQIIIESKQNSGAAHTRNYGAQIARGNYLIFLDADDELNDGAISAIRAHIKNNPHTFMIIGSHNSILPNGKSKLHRASSIPKSAFQRVKGYLIDKSISISNGASAIRSDVFKKIKYPEKFRNSEDIPVFAKILANYECTTLNYTLANVYKHKDSLRHNLNYAETVGMALVDEIFSDSMPEECQPLKKSFQIQRLLSLSRVAYESGVHSKSVAYFYEAFKLNWKVLFKWSYSKKLIKSLVKLLK